MKRIGQRPRGPVRMSLRHAAGRVEKTAVDRQNMSVEPRETPRRPADAKEIVDIKTKRQPESPAGRTRLTFSSPLPTGIYKLKENGRVEAARIGMAQASTTP